MTSIRRIVLIERTEEGFTQRASCAETKPAAKIGGRLGDLAAHLTH